MRVLLDENVDRRLKRAFEEQHEVSTGPLSGNEAKLIDASCGTILLRQLKDTAISLESVRHPFVTHCQFDHVGGLAPLLTAMAALSEASLTVHATSETLTALRELLALTIPGVDGSGWEGAFDF